MPGQWAQPRMLQGLFEWQPSRVQWAGMRGAPVGSLPAAPAPNPLLHSTQLRPPPTPSSIPLMTWDTGSRDSQ